MFNEIFVINLQAACFKILLCIKLNLILYNFDINNPAVLVDL